MAKSTPANNPELSVSELSAALKRTVEDRFGFVRVRGEISNFRGRHSSGHSYFSLKDDGARIDAVVWKGAYARLKQKPEEGLEVIATGRLTTFPGKSAYQIVIEAMEPAEIGALMALLEERRRKFIAEGLFDAARKRPLPFLPLVIGVVTSPTGAVIRDILHRIGDRFPRHVMVWPVRVQGETAAAEVAAAIAGFNALDDHPTLRRPDVLIVARGGGSLEDLWAFNEEIVVRAAADSRIPLISAIGHETDTTLIDHVADLRAPTPTGAAEKAVPVHADLHVQIADLARRHRQTLRRALDKHQRDLRALTRVLKSADDVLAAPRQKFDAAVQKLHAQARQRVADRRRALGELSVLLARHAPHVELERARNRLDGAAKRFDAAQARLRERRLERLAATRRAFSAALAQDARRRVDESKARRAALGALHRRLAPAFARAVQLRRAELAAQDKLLATLSYKNVLARGFALVRDERGAPVRAALSVAVGQRLEIQFADGRVGAVAQDRDALPPAVDAPVDAASHVVAPDGAPEPIKKDAPKRAKPSRENADQGSLF